MNVPILHPGYFVTVHIKDLTVGKVILNSRDLGTNRLVSKDDSKSRVDSSSFGCADKVKT